MVGEYIGSPRSPLFESFGRYFLVECKNWDAKVGAPELRVFDHKLDEYRVPLGIYFARNGITGPDPSRDARGVVLGAQHRGERTVLVITLEHINMVVEGVNLHSLLDEFADRLRFNLP